MNTLLNQTTTYFLKIFKVLKSRFGDAFVPRGSMGNFTYIQINWNCSTQHVLIVILMSSIFFPQQARNASENLYLCDLVCCHVDSYTNFVQFISYLNTFSQQHGFVFVLTDSWGHSSESAGSAVCGDSFVFDSIFSCYRLDFTVHCISCSWGKEAW